MINHLTATELQNRFQYHAPTPVAIKAHERVRNLLYAVAYGLLALVPPGREQSSMITHLEEAMFWGNAGIARNHDRLEAHLQEPTAAALMSDGNPSSMTDWETALVSRFLMDVDNGVGHPRMLFRDNGDGTTSIATIEDLKAFMRQWLTSC